jgi:hypothetical protein
VAIKTLPAGVRGDPELLKRFRHEAGCSPSGVTITLAGLRSRCTTPRACAAAMASASGMAIWSSRSSG